MEKDFILDTLIKKSIPLTCTGSSQCSIKIIGKNEQYLQGILQSDDCHPPHHGIYTSDMDAMRTISMELTVSTSEHPRYTFIMPSLLELIDKQQKGPGQSSMQLLCSFDNDTLEISNFAAPKHTPPSCIIFPDIHTADPAVCHPFPENNSIVLPLPHWFPSYSALASLSKETGKVLYFDYQQGIPEKNSCIGTKLITRSDFETVAANTTKAKQAAIKQELKQIAEQNKNICIYPLSIFHAKQTDVTVWQHQGIVHTQVSKVLHILDAINLTSLCAHNCNGTMIAGLFTHGLIACIAKKLVQNSGTCLLILEKRTIRGSITFELLWNTQDTWFYYCRFSALEPEDYRFLAEYVTNCPITDADFETEEMQSICSL